MSRITIMISLPRAGKTTYCRQQASELPNIVVISGDDIRKALGCRYNSYTEELVASMERIMIRSVLENPNTSVLVDDCHTSWDRIKPILQIDPSAEFKFFPDFDTLADLKGRNSLKKLCKERAILSNQPDLIKVIDRMADSLERMLPTFHDYLGIERARASLYDMVVKVA